jgi:hypothetical protein
MSFSKVESWYLLKENLTLDSSLSMGNSTLSLVMSFVAESQGETQKTSNLLPRQIHGNKIETET